MSFKSIFHKFLPKDQRFFPLFEQMSDQLIEMGKLLVEGVHTEDLNARATVFGKIEDYEHKCDSITHQVHLELGKNSVPPFDRADIHTLISALDDVADFINGSSNRMYLYKVERITDPIRDLADLILEATVEVSKAVHELRNLRNTRKITDSFVRI